MNTAFGVFLCAGGAALKERTVQCSCEDESWVRGLQTVMTISRPPNDDLFGSKHVAGTGKSVPLLA